ncbi:MAG: hypothetical protein H0U67_03370 [Gemmatimonadetes bacterium]|nr:hypothetical protein [Gemmatimonadota bacterium]
MSDLERLVSSQEWCEDARELDFEAWCERHIAALEGHDADAFHLYVGVKRLLRMIHPPATEEIWSPRAKKVYEFCRTLILEEEPTLQFSKEADV